MKTTGKPVGKGFIRNVQDKNGGHVLKGFKNVVAVHNLGNIIQN